jgi:ABC-type polysaccharide/polyol phosphate transport system ATPase subunit
MSGPSPIVVQDVHKSFVMSTSGAASLKTALLWWKKRATKRVEVLKGISFDVRPGECLAVLGRNGAGKSTLLSLIARIYRPTSGRVDVNGRIAPLLELGAGFHPDLTGVDNVLFNAVGLGLTRAQAQDRMGAIHEFSELKDYIHAPVRTYSSGMLARLGFAIAIHVDADILLVDEVLSVGDFDFQRKCLKRIEEFQSTGGSILFVSHEMNTIQKVATRCMWLQHGVVEQIGSPDEVLPEYRARSSSDLGRGT